MPRAKNPRRVVFISGLKPLLSNVRAMVDTWGGPQHSNVDGRWQLAPAADQPENSVEQWQRLEDFATAMENQAASLKRAARRMRREVEEGTRF